jgi:hypothetical protein
VLIKQLRVDRGQVQRGPTRAGRDNDTYLNNAGSNLVDLLRGPAGSVAPMTAPARGCERFALEFPNQRQAAVALLIGAVGNDT